MAPGIFARAALILCVLLSVTSAMILEECVTQCYKLQKRLNKTIEILRPECDSNIPKCIQKCYPSKQTDQFVSISEAMCDVGFKDLAEANNCIKENIPKMVDECLLVGSFLTLEEMLITEPIDISTDEVKTNRIDITTLGDWKIVCKKLKLDRDCMVPFLRSRCGDKAADRKIAEFKRQFIMYEAFVESESDIEWPQDCRDLASAGHKRILGSICLILVALVNLRYYIFTRLF